jgi:hypothetical protein
MAQPIVLCDPSGTGTVKTCYGFGTKLAQRCMYTANLSSPQHANTPDGHSMPMQAGE